MLDLFNIPTPQTANYQEFYGGASTTTRSWIKPRGASMVRFLLIGPGGGGDIGTASNGGTGGESGAVTSWIGPAIFIPDILQIVVGNGVNSGNAGTTQVYYRAANGNNQLLYALGGTTAGSGNATAMTANNFTACGIFRAVGGQAGGAAGTTGAGGNVSASSTTFLSGGAGGSGGNLSTGGSVTPNYGYTPLPATTAGGTVKGADGYFITSPIMVGTGGAGGTTDNAIGSAGGKGGLGCGGGGAGEDYTTARSFGGDGAVFVWAW